MTALAFGSFRPTEGARYSDRHRLSELLEAAVPDCHPETAKEVDSTWPDFRVLRDGSGRVVAAGALQSLGDERAEIRGLVVAPEARGQGLAQIIVRDLIEAARSLGLDTVCVTRRPEFFRRFGFEESEQSWDLTLHGRRAPMMVAGRPRVAMTLSEASR